MQREPEWPLLTPSNYSLSALSAAKAQLGCQIVAGRAHDHLTFTLLTRILRERSGHATLDTAKKFYSGVAQIRKIPLVCLAVWNRLSAAVCLKPTRTRATLSRSKTRPWYTALPATSPGALRDSCRRAATQQRPPSPCPAGSGALPAPLVRGHRPPTLRPNSSPTAPPCSPCAPLPCSTQLPQQHPARCTQLT